MGNCAVCGLRSGKTNEAGETGLSEAQKKEPPAHVLACPERDVAYSQSRFELCGVDEGRDGLALEFAALRCGFAPESTSADMADINEELARAAMRRSVAADRRSTRKTMKGEVSVEDQKRLSRLASETTSQREVTEAWVEEIDDADSDDDIEKLFGSMPEEARDNAEVTLTAIDRDPKAIRRASAAMKSNREVVIAAVGQRGELLQHSGELLRGDRAVVLAAVQQDGQALAFAADSLKSDKELVLLAVAQSAGALQHADDSLKGDKEVLILALRDVPGVSADLDLRELALAAVRQDASLFPCMPADVRADRSVALAAVKRRGRSLRDVSDALRADRELALAAVFSDGLALEFASEALRVDREVVLAAVTENFSALKFAHESMKDDNEIVLVALQSADDFM